MQVKRAPFYVCCQPEAKEKQRENMRGTKSLARELEKTAFLTMLNKHLAGALVTRAPALAQCCFQNSCQHCNRDYVLRRGALDMHGSAL